MVSPTSNRVRELNDAFRAIGPSAGDWMLTAGVNAKGPIFTLQASLQVQNFADFSPDNDPYEEHDFGAFDLAGEKLFWKIDYYDHSLQAGSENPADPALTRRVLTIMLASEY